MNKKLKVALTRRSSEQGFALPIALGLGFVMLLIAATMIMRSQGDQVTASAQKATADSLGTSEAGVTRVQSLLDRWRVLSNITLVNIGTSSSSWQQVYNASPANACLPAVASNPTSGYRLNEWINLDSQRQFRIIDYTYKPNPYNFPDGSSGGPRDPAQVNGSTTIPTSGAVTVSILPTNYLPDGKSASGQIKGIQGTLSNSAGTYSFTRKYSAATTTSIASSDKFYPDSVPGVGTLKLEGKLSSGITATSVLQVDIPVNQGSRNSVPFPGLWVQQGTIPNNNTIQGNLLVKGCNANIGGTVSPRPPYDRFSNPYISLPDLPLIPTTNITNLGTLDSSKKLPQSTDSYVEVGGVREYRYRVTSINLTSGSDTVTILPGRKVFNTSTNSEQSISTDKKVIFYLDGNIDVSGSREIKHNCSGVSSCKPTDFQIYAYGSGGHICMNGSGATYGFILAPDYTVGIAGSGSNAGFIGSIWVNKWNPPPPTGISSCGSNTSNTVVQQTADWSDLGPALTPKNIPPQLGSFSSWQRQEAS